MGLFEKLKAGLAKTKEGIVSKVDNLVKHFVKVDEDLLEELEEILITSDVGVETSEEIIDALRMRVKDERISDADGVRAALKDILSGMIGESGELTLKTNPSVILVIGVNGVGKTTSIAKMAHYLKETCGKKVLLAAADTFRAAAIDQLDIWANRVGVDIVKHSENSDPAAVVFDAINAAKKRGADVLIIDTAGRLHNKTNLMNELGKINRVIDRELPSCDKETMLVLDATTGQNAVIQAKEFKSVAPITSLILTKLDGTAKGGVIFSIKKELDLPVKFIGVGEGMDDLQPFDRDTFTEALFS